jgi:rhodanese-related sulfurtransferase
MNRIIGIRSDIWVILAAIVLTVAGCAGSREAAPPTITAAADSAVDWRFHDIVDLEFVMAHIGIPMPQDVALIDARPKRAKYDKGHIPGAINIPDTYFDKYKDRLPEEKSTLLIFYCGGLHCKLSHKSAAKAEALGYTNVKVFAAGYPAWKQAGGGAGIQADVAPAKIKSGSEEGSIDIAQFKEIVADRPDSVMLIDVRDADEFKKGSFKSAINIPVDTLEGKIKSLPADKPIIFVCGTGARSGESYYMVQDLRPELKNVFYLEAELIFNGNGTYTLKEPT